MSRKFTLISDYYDAEFKLYKKTKITLNEGVTILVGCNGSGKSTFLYQLKEQLKKKNIPVIHFDNLKDGGSRAISSAGFYGEIAFMATALQSSEGENIVLNMSKLASNLRSFICTGKVNSKNEAFLSTMAKAINGEDKEKKEKEIPNERWILLDAIDSGLSVDNVVDIKECLFKTILEDNFSGSIYIVVSANEYELARNENCFDVYNGEYIKFKDYEEYRDFILNSRKIKDDRYDEDK